MGKTEQLEVLLFAFRDQVREVLGEDMLAVTATVATMDGDTSSINEVAMRGGVTRAALDQVMDMYLTAPLDLGGRMLEDLAKEEGPLGGEFRKLRQDDGATPAQLAPAHIYLADHALNMLMQHKERHIMDMVLGDGKLADIDEMSKQLHAFTGDPKTKRMFLNMVKNLLRMAFLELPKEEVFNTVYAAEQDVNKAEDLGSTVVPTGRH